MAGDALDLRELDTDCRASGVGDDVEARILVATSTCLARFGLAKTTIDDIAREASCSRATVYRYFPNRPSVIRAAVERDLDDLTRAVLAAGRAEDSLENAVTAMFVAASRAIAGHPALQRALDLEPGLVLPALSFEGGDRLLAEAGRRFAPALARFVPRDRAPRAAEWCVRVLLAYVHPDRAATVLTDETSARALVRRHVIPAIARSSLQPHEVLR